jgi:hypothetical protein
MKLRAFLQARFAPAESLLLCSAQYCARIFEVAPMARKNFVQSTVNLQIEAMQLSIFAAILSLDSRSRKGPS